mmetsp:Transcript_11802/g.26760  ORF Transcript_11802/g.26760 Transcript_11802/m.26760 type:complete len:235 (-) Transcript_11802:895-1599(-)
MLRMLLQQQLRWHRLCFSRARSCSYWLASLRYLLSHLCSLCLGGLSNITFLCKPWVLRSAWQAIVRVLPGCCGALRSLHGLCWRAVSRCCKRIGPCCPRRCCTVQADRCLQGGILAGSCCSSTKLSCTPQQRVRHRAILTLSAQASSSRARPRRRSAPAAACPSPSSASTCFSRSLRLGSGVDIGSTQALWSATACNWLRVNIHTCLHLFDVLAKAASGGIQGQMTRLLALRSG